jgi:hypothetical protein
VPCVSGFPRSSLTFSSLESPLQIQLSNVVVAQAGGRKKKRKQPVREPAHRRYVCVTRERRFRFGQRDPFHRYWCWEERLKRTSNGVKVIGSRPASNVIGRQTAKRRRVEPRVKLERRISRNQANVGRPTVNLPPMTGAPHGSERTRADSSSSSVRPGDQNVPYTPTTCRH